MAPIKNFQLLFVIVVVLLTGCFDRKKDSRPEGFIAQEEVVKILTQLYIADGLLDLHPIRKEFEMKDSTQNYSDIIESHGYTKERFDNTISYLFANNPKKLEAIYDRVIANLSIMEADIMKERNGGDIGVKNYYTGIPSIRLPDDGVNTKLELDEMIDRPGEYELRTRVLIYDDDQSINPYINLWFWYDDNTVTGHIEPWDTVWLDTRGKSVLIAIKKEMADTNATHIRGFLFNHTEQSGHWEKHASFSGISINVTSQKDTKVSTRRE
jgi:hypothetical protein